MRLLQILFSVFRLGFLFVLFSRPMFGAYTAAAAVHVISGQVPYLLGYRIKSYYYGPIKLYYVCTMYITQY